MPSNPALEVTPQHHDKSYDDREKPVIPEHAARTQKGVAEVEAVNAVWGPTSKGFLFFGIACIAYTYSLDGSTTYQYQAFATSSFMMHSSLSTIAVVQAIILAIAKPVSAKISDVFGRAEAFIVSVILYVVGYIVVATSSGIASYGAGAVIYYMGYASIQILIQIVIADVTTLRWRTFVAQSASAPYFINAFVSARIAEGILPQWKWGYGMFAIIIPVGAAPIILTLLWAQRKARKLGVLATVYHGEAVAVKPEEHSMNLFRARTFKHAMACIKHSMACIKHSFTQFRYSLVEIDIIGLILIGLSLALILVPLTLTNSGDSSWSSASVIAMLVMGFVCLGITIVYEGWFAKYPAVPGRFMKNPTVLAACIINLFDFISFYLQFTYQYSFIYITRFPEWSIAELGYFANTQTLALTFFAIFAGLYIIVFRRLKVLLIVGLAIRMLGVGLMIRARGANGTTAELVIVQILQGAGGGIAAGATQTAAQGVVPHQDLSAVTAVVLLFAEVGNAIGTAIAGAIWRNTMPNELNNNLTGLLDQTAIDGIFNSITTAAEYPRGQPIFQGIRASYTRTMELLLIPATCLALIPIIAAFFVQNLRLGNVRNIVEEEDTASIDSRDEKL